MSFLFPTWKDDLVYADTLYKKASLNGALFYVKSSEAKFGSKSRSYLRWKGEPVTEFVGVEPDRFQVEGYIIASDLNSKRYFDERDELIKALKKISGVTRAGGKTDKITNFVEDPSTLIHPFYGALEVFIESPATITESFEEGGIARFNMSFIQAGLSTFPGITEDYINLVNGFSLAMALAFIDGFLADFRAAGAFSGKRIK
jgi:hypothetical protein